mmetsp:Transcript_74020/g.176191  ORF Transcript_74020/g.176191 Transcript_74020/m.176191 type:complete len:303 (+) Transcript_74020:68-976(+)
MWKGVTLSSAHGFPAPKVTLSISELTLLQPGQVVLELLLALLQALRSVEVFLLHRIELLLGDALQFLLDDIGIRAQGTVLCIACRGFGLRGVVARSGVFGSLWLLWFLWLLYLLELVELLLKLVQLLLHLYLGVGWSLMQGERILLLRLLGPPLLEVCHLLEGGICFVFFHPRHILSDLFVCLFQVGEGLFNVVGQVCPSLKLESSLLDGSQQLLQPRQPLVILVLVGGCLPHPILVFSAEFGNLFTLLLRGHLHNVLAFQLVARTIDGSLQFILHLCHGHHLSFMLCHGLELLLGFSDVLL